MDWLLYPYWAIKRNLAKRRFLERLKEEAAEEFLEGLLQLLKISSHVDGYLRRSMKDFNGRSGSWPISKTAVSMKENSIPRRSCGLLPMQALFSRMQRR